MMKIYNPMKQLLFLLLYMGAHLVFTYLHGIDEIQYVKDGGDYV